MYMGACACCFQEVDKETKLISDEQVPLHIVVFKKDADLSSQHIAGFGAVVERHHGLAVGTADVVGLLCVPLEDSITPRDGSLGVPGHRSGRTTDWNAIPELTNSS